MSPTAEPTPSAPLTLAPFEAGAGLSVSSPTPCPPAPCAPVDAATLAAVMAAMREQEETLRQIQATLAQLLRGLGSPQAPAADAPRVTATLTTTLTVADPMGAGFSLSQRALADALAIPASYVSTLVRAFKLDEDPRCALTVRPGAKRLVNYHPRAIERFRELVSNPPASLDERARRTVEQVRSRLHEAAANDAAERAVACPG